MLNLCGFTYGINGFLIAAFASLVASAVVFIVLRYLFGEDLRSWSERNETWNAVEAVVVSYHIIPLLAMVLAYIIQDAKGLPLIILIRVSPFPPWAYSNSLFAVSRPDLFTAALTEHQPWLISLYNPCHSGSLWWRQSATFQSISYTFSLVPVWPHYPMENRGSIWTPVTVMSCYL